MPAVDTIWFTRCPVPTATGLAYKLGWLDEEFSPDGIKVRTLQDNRELLRHHYDHELTSLIREGGNLFSIPARGQGARTKLVGLTWIDEWQSILVRPGSGIGTPQDLVGKRLALPAFRPADLAENKRGRSIARGMSLAGYKGALASISRTLDDVQLVEVGSEVASDDGREDLGRLWSGLGALVSGRVDGVYVKGAAAAEAARRHGAIVGIDLDRLSERRFRVNNGTPRPITAHEELIERHPDLLIRFLYQTLRAADWAKENLDGVRRVLEGETRSGASGVAEAYRDGFQLTLAPDLSDERLDLFRRQKDFQLIHGFLDRDFDFDSWIDPRPLQEAQRRWELSQKGQAA